MVLHRERIAGRGVRADTLTHGWCRCSTHTTNLIDYPNMQTRRHRHTDILQTQTLGMALQRNYAPTLIIIGK